MRYHTALIRMPVWFCYRSALQDLRISVFFREATGRDDTLLCGSRVKFCVTNQREADAFANVFTVPQPPV